MTSDERVLQYVADANPIPDPQMLDLRSFESVDLTVTRRRTVMQTREREGLSSVPDMKRRGPRWVVVFAAFAVVIAAGVGSWLLLAGDGTEVAEGGLGDPPSEPVAVTMTGDVPYSTHAEVNRGWGIEAGQTLTMDRYVPQGDGPWPTLVMLHSRSQDKAQLGNFARAVAERGALVYVPDYLYAEVGESSEALLSSGVWLGTRSIGDLRCAIRVARADALDHGGAGDLVVVGYGYGAAFGATLALAGDDPSVLPGTSGTCVASGGSATPGAFVGLEGNYDWYAYAEEYFPVFGAVDPEVWRALSPLTHTASTAPESPVSFHLLAGDLTVDRIGSRALQMEEFESALAAAGYPVSASVLPGEPAAAFHQVSIMPPEVIDSIIGAAYDHGG